MLQRAWYAILQFVAQVLFVCLLQGRAFHRERVPRQGGLLAVSNHQSYLDPILAALAIGRPFNPMARDSLFRTPGFSWLIRSLYAFPVKRAAADLGAIREAIRRLRDGQIVLVFPEGTRTRDGAIGQLHAGIVLIAQRAGVPIMPVVIDGAFQCWPRSRILPTLHPVRVIYGEPIPLEDVRDCAPEALAARLHDEMLRLQAEMRRGRAAHG
jgi:1-acyl-sn-glycerol-3-phosphate acyltransferase